MLGKIKSTLSANKMIRQIQENFVTREDKEPEYYTASPSPSPSPSPRMSKRSRKRSSADFTFGDQSDDRRLSFSVLARTKSQSSTPKNMNLVQQPDKQETEETISKNGKQLHQLKCFICFLVEYFYHFLMKSYWVYAIVSNSE